MATEARVAAVVVAARVTGQKEVSGVDRWRKEEEEERCLAAFRFQSACCQREGGPPPFFLAESAEDQERFLPKAN